MLFSKSFGYAIRATLYLAMLREQKPKIQLDEIAAALNVPRYFVGKVMNRLVKGGLIDSIKGHHGGFCINEKTMATSLATLCVATGDTRQLNLCVLQLKECNESNPCPFHHHISDLRQQWLELLEQTTIGELLNNNQPDFIKTLRLPGKTESHNPVPVSEQIIVKD